MADPTTYEIVKTDSEKFVNYKISLTVNGETWFVVRRYKEFRYLYDELKKLFPKAHLKIPRKQLIGNFSNCTIKKRVRGLNKLVTQIFSMPEALNLEVCQEFFKIPVIPDSSDTISSHNDTIASPDEDTGQVSDGIDPLNDKKMSPSDFTFQTCIGKGSFSRVYLGKQKTTGDFYAIKVVTKSRIKCEKTRANLMSERNVLLNNLKHPFLVSLKFAFQTATKLYFVVDYINGGELFFHLQKEKSFSEPRAKFYAAEIACALGFMHSQHIVYRDVKPENLLLDREGHIVLTDFGLSKKLDPEAGECTDTFCGTPEYLPPEMLRKQPYSYPIDWWSLGCVLYEMLFAIPPFFMSNQELTFDAIKTSQVNFTRRNIKISKEAENFLIKLLDKDPTTRLGSKNDLEDLEQHSYFSSSFHMREIEERKVEVPFKPSVKSEDDTSLIDEGFKAFEIGSPQFSVGVSINDEDNFIGFTYTRPMGECFE